MDAPIKHRCLAAGEKARDPLCSSNRQETKSEWEQVCQWDTDCLPPPPPRPALIGLTRCWHSYTLSNMAAGPLWNLWNLTLTVKVETRITQTLRHSSSPNLYTTTSATPVKGGVQIDSTAIVCTPWCQRLSPPEFSDNFKSSVNAMHSAQRKTTVAKHSASKDNSVSSLNHMVSF